MANAIFTLFPAGKTWAAHPKALGFLDTPFPLPQSMQRKFLPMVLHWRASRAGA